MRRVLLLPAVSVPVLALLAGCGSGDGSPTATASGDERVIEVEMRDIAFVPATIDVRAGEKVRFVFKNTGRVTHDAFLGDAATQETYEREMRGGGSGAMSEGVSVKPGRTASLTRTFDQPGQTLLGCHQPGHYTGGMRATVSIA